jgi:hypothetical protein
MPAGTNDDPRAAAMRRAGLEPMKRVSARMRSNDTRVPIGWRPPWDERASVLPPMIVYAQLERACYPNVQSMIN